MSREQLIDHAVRNVMRLGSIPQGYVSVITVNRPAVRAWWRDGGPRNAWWFAFASHVQAEVRRLEVEALRQPLNAAPVNHSLPLERFERYRPFGAADEMPFNANRQERPA